MPLIKVRTRTRLGYTRNGKLRESLQELISASNRQNLKSKQEIQKLVKTYRYYNKIPFEEGKNISEVKGLESKIEETSKKLFEKAYELKALEEISKNENVNYKIIKKVFDTRSINLEELYIKIIKEKDRYFLQTFDEKLAEEKIELETLEMINKKELALKIGKKIKIFS